MIASKLGRDASGMGGGAPAPVIDVGSGLDAGMGGGVSVDLFIAKDNADLGGGGNLRVGTSLVVFDAGLVGKGGRVGNCGGGALADVITFDFESITVLIVVFCFEFSRAFLAGRGGNLVGS
jgi:hypothetical protein